MNHFLGIMIESLVAVLLMLTVGYCMLLNKRLQRLKADEHSLKATIAELITATEIAERAIGGLKHTVRDVNENLGNQLTAAAQMSQQLKKQLAEGDGIVRRLSRIAIAARPGGEAEPESEPAPARAPAARAIAAAAPEVAKPDGVVVFPEQTQPVSASERAILERLQARRQELDARAREVDIRESLLKAAEKRIESRVEELKAVESRTTTATGQKAETDAARFKGIITMYEGMKPKDAAKAFDRLEMSVLYEIASQIAPRKMSDILGLMQPEAAERLTVELARRAGTDKSTSTAELPKIEGKILQQRSN